MAFMLGSFTNGLFGGAGDVFNIANQWEKLKQNKMTTANMEQFQTAGKQVSQALKTDEAAPSPTTTPVSVGSDTAGTAPVTPVTSAPLAPDDLSFMPTPKHMQGLPIGSATPARYLPTAPSPTSAPGGAPPAAGSANSSVANSSAMPLSPAARSALGMTPAELSQARSAWQSYAAMTPAQRYTMTREGKAAPVNPDAPAGADALRAAREGKMQVSPQFQDAFGSSQPTQATGGAFAPAAPGSNPSYAAVREGQPLPVPRTAAPQYLPNSTVPGVQVAPSSPMAINTGPIMPAIGGGLSAMGVAPGATAPVPGSPNRAGMPSLAGGQVGLGAMILNAINPTGAP
jgi:hypothetical protein